MFERAINTWRSTRIRQLLSKCSGSAKKKDVVGGEGRSRLGSASMRRADAAQICNEAGFVAVHDPAVATAARQTVSKIL
jgi:hypothetical protein